MHLSGDVKQWRDQASIMAEVVIYSARTFIGWTDFIETIVGLFEDIHGLELCLTITE